MAQRDDRVHSENESGRFQPADSHQQEHVQARTESYIGQNGHQLSRLDPANGRDLGRTQPSVTGTIFFRSNLVARKSAQSYQPTGRPRGRPRNKSRSEEDCLPLPRVPSTVRHQAVTRSNGTEIDRYTNKKNENETSNARSRKNDRAKNSGDALVTQGRAGCLSPREDSVIYKRSGLSMTTDSSDIIGEYRLVNDEPPKSRLKRTPEIDIECLSQDHSTDIARNRTLPTESQFLSPPELKSGRLSTGLRSNASALPGSDHHNPRLVTINGKLETDIVKPISTSVSSGNIAPQPYPYSGRKRARCANSSLYLRCEKPGEPTNDLFLCIECEQPYHSLCHRPAKAIPNNKTWRCQRCITRSEQQSNASTPKGQSSNSFSSETSASSVTSTALIPVSTGPSFKSDVPGVNGTEHPRNEDACPEDINSYSDDDHRMIKRPKGGISTQHQWSTEDPAFDGAYRAPECDGLVRSKIFHRSQTFAVVIDSHSRSTSASTDGKRSDHQGFGPSDTAKVSQEWVTKRTGIASRSSSPPPAPTIYCEDLSALKQTRFPSEIKDSQEMDYEMADAQMSLDADPHSPMQERNIVHGNMTSNTLGRSYWTNGPFMTYGDQSFEGPRTLPENSSPHYSPSVGDRERSENERYINREYRETSSPPYSPPGPDVDVSYGNPGPNDLTNIPLPKEHPKNSDDGFFCVMCKFYVQNNTQYKDNICGACSPSGPPRRNPRVTQESLQITSQRTARHSRHPNSSKSHRRRSRKQHLGHFGSALPTGLQNNEASKNLTPEEFYSAPSARTFQTSKDRVIEKYQMKPGAPEPVPGPKPRIISVLRKNKDEETIKNALEPHAGPCGNPDIGENLQAVAANEESRKSIRSSNSTGPARKFPSTPIPHDSPTRRMVDTTERPVSRSGDALPKKIPRRPAVKNANGSIQFTDSDDSDDPVNDSARIQMLEKRLEEQKSCTKNQRNEARRLQEKLADAAREAKKIRAELSAALAQVRKINKSNPVQVDQNDETKACDKLAKPSIGKLAKVPLKLKDLYKDIDFTASLPWPCPPELPEPDPSTFRKPGWRKQHQKYDTKRVLKLHLHRQLIRVKSPPLLVAPGSPYSLTNPHGDSRGSSLDDEYSEYCLGEPETIDEFLGFPENMVPAVKDGVLGFRPGIINQRTRRLDRNVQHYKVRTPGALLDRI